ncbi:hypothetical protein FIBSPDRAFT_943943 [Athelia psychrophila]|uniref:Uncharacterized protein n=1 Tax=Athelia psychrophila TaxID=1759441 RepID=A0A166VR00_9AGAM|nr:hypothetical protein FIBSPDRAFT_943943 [Fibularhizoctonia sp. CBS 109695]
MDYTPRYPQPFSLEQAIHLEVPIISEEITRLQHSLQHLKSTQEELREYVASESQPDPELVAAIVENEGVIGSQEERITILRLALSHKGIPTSNHYNLSPQIAHATPSPIPNGITARSLSTAANPAIEEDDEDGVHL